jgi:hypothetical protein
MARPRRSPDSPSYSHGQAHYVLSRLLDERKISHGEVGRYVGEMHGEISSLEKRLASLREAAGHSAAASGGQTGGARRGRPPGSGKRRGRPPASASAASSSGSSAPAAPARRGRPPGSGKKRKSVLSAEQLASRQLQGRYLGLIRQIPASRRGQYQKIAKEKGREAAIKEMQGDLKK